MMKRLLHVLPLVVLPFLISAQAVITSVFDADLPGGLPKGVEIYVLQDIPDLSGLGIGSANNGGGTDGVEFEFPAMPVDSGTYLYVSSDTAMFEAFFGFSPDFVSIAMAINGDDAIELFWDSVSIDVFGDINVDGTGQPWEYMNGWAARKALTGPDGSTFVLQNWYFSGPNALDGELTNADAQTPVPLKTYTDTTSVGPDVTVIAHDLMFEPKDVTIEVGQTVRWTNIETFSAHNVNGLQEVYPCNPVGLYSGDAALGPWDFDVTFNVAGEYKYQCDPHLSSGMVGTVTVIDPNAPDYPMYDISTILAEDMDGVADSAGVECQLQGVVHGPNFRPQGLQFTIIDVAAGKGINVFKSGEDCYPVTEGEMISIKGSISQFNGLTEIIPEAQIKVLATGQPLMTPQEVSDPLDESMESTMVLVNNITVDSILSTGSSGWNLFGTNTSGNSYLVRLDADVFTDVSGYEGQVLNVTGIVGQFDPQPPYLDGYQLQPRGPADMEVAVRVKTLPSSAVTMHPNPASEYVRFNTDEVILGVEAYQSNGQMIPVRRIDERTIDVSVLPAGQYIIILTTENGRWTSPLIKE